jgi:hypothetical protein
MRRGRKWYALLGLVGWLVVGFLGVRPASALYLDDAQTMIFTSTFYTQYRMRLNDSRGANTKASAGNMFQHRFFLDPTIRVTVTPWFDRVPGGSLIQEALSIHEARFLFNPRFEYDAVYDYGPAGYRNLRPYDLQNASRFQIFELYGETSHLGGRLNIRAGRQNLSWGETDIFRVIDQINPLDNGFGGFLLPLDERRRPLTMVRFSLGLAEFPDWNIYNLTLQAFIAPDNRNPLEGVGGQPWDVTPGALNTTIAPTFNASLDACADRAGCDFIGTQNPRPDRNLGDSRAGVRLLSTIGDTTVTLNWLTTYNAEDIGTTINLEETSNREDLVLKIKNNNNYQLVGATASAPVSQFYWVPILKNLTYSVFRAEIAGSFGRAFFKENENLAVGNRIPKRDVIQWAFGLDHTQWFRSLNPANTFFLSAQHFHRSIQGSVGGLRIPLSLTKHNGGNKNRFANLYRNAHYSTFIANTLYNASFFFGLAQVMPQFVVIYDWSGSWLIQPQLTFINDPWRFRIEYNYIEGRFDGPTGVGLTKDWDNIAFRIDYLLF